MTFQFLDLDATTRAHMLGELRFDLLCGQVYSGRRLVEAARVALPGVLLDAFEWGSVETIAKALRRNRWIEQYEQRATREGRRIRVRTPINAATVFARGVFNHYYMRAIARRAIDEALPAIEVYRARAARNPRPESERKVGERIDPVLLLLDLRSGRPALGVPSGPGSGLSVALPRTVTTRFGEPDMIVDRVGLAVLWSRKRVLRTAQRV